MGFDLGGVQIVQKDLAVARLHDQHSIICIDCVIVLRPEHELVRRQIQNIRHVILQRPNHHITAVRGGLQPLAAKRESLENFPGRELQDCRVLDVAIHGCKAVRIQKSETDSGHFGKGPVQRDLLVSSQVYGDCISGACSEELFRIRRKAEMNPLDMNSRLGLNKYLQLDKVHLQSVRKEKTLLGEDLIALRDIVERDSQAPVQTGERLAIRRELALAASFGYSYVMHRRSLLVDYVPFLDSQSGCIEDDILRVRRELCRMRVRRIDPEEQAEWIAG